MACFKKFPLRTLSFNAFFTAIIAVSIIGITSNAYASVTRDDAFTLLHKTGFQPTESEIESIMAYPTREAAVNAIVDGITSSTVSTQCPWMLSHTSTPNVEDTNTAYISSQLCYSAYAKSNGFASAVLANWWVAVMFQQDLKDWFVSEMIYSPSPLTQRLMLFWHNHFTTSFQEDGNAWELWNQDLTLRANVGGNFRTMTKQMLHDPALLYYLNEPQSVYTAPSASNPNPPVPTANFAREFLELFTMGQGNYVEFPNADGITVKDDVTETARALSGLTYDRTNGVPYTLEAYAPYPQVHSYLYTSPITKQQAAYDYIPSAHDPGSKTILGQTGNWQPDDVVDIVLNHRAAPNLPTSTALLIVNELWQEFVSPLPMPNPTFEADAQQRINTIAASFSNDYEIKPVLKAILNTPEFWGTHGHLVKSPAEFVVGAVRSLGLPSNELDTYRSFIESTGMTLFTPPNVRGFLTGINWINTNTLHARQSVAYQLANLWYDHVYSLPAGAAFYPAYSATYYTSVFAKLQLGPRIPPMLLAPPAPLTAQELKEYPLQMQIQLLSDPAYSLK